MKQGGYRRAGVLAARVLASRARAILADHRRSGSSGARVRSHGFTVIETMIVLAVTGVLFISAVVLINGRQARTQFATAINGLQQQLQQIINETANGFYPRDSAFSCVKGSGAPPVLGVKTSGDYQGQNADCIFMGKVLQFGVKDKDPQTYQIIPIIANRTINGSNDVEASTLYGSTGAFPEAAAKSSQYPAITGIDTSATLAGGLRVVSMYYGTDPADAAKSIGAVGFISSLPSPSGPGVASGTQSLGLYRVVGSALQQLPQDVASLLFPISGSTPLVAVKSVNICVASGTTRQSGLITIGTNDSSSAASLAVDLAIKTGTAC